RFSRDWSSDVCSSDLDAADVRAQQFYQEFPVRVSLEVGSNQTEVTIVNTLRSPITVHNVLIDDVEVLDSPIEIDTSDSTTFVTRSEERRVGKECRSLV